MFRSMILVAVVLPSTVVNCESALADIWKEGKDPASLPFQPRLEKLANRSDRVYGRWNEDPHSWRENGAIVTTTDLIVAVDPSGHFCFSGDTEALNGFLKDYAALKDEPLSVDRPPCLVIHAGRALLEKGHSYDWKMSWVMHIRKRPQTKEQLLVHGVSKVEVWLGGKVTLEGLKVPVNIEVKSGGEIEKFIAEHEARRKEAGAND